MNVFAVSLPMPPSANNMFATDFKTKRRFITKDYAAWRKAAGGKLIDQWEDAGKPSFDRHIAVSIHLGLNYRSDISGRVKALEDLLVAIVPGFPDDRYIDREEIERVPGLDGARVLITQLAPPEARRCEAVPFGELAADIVRRVAVSTREDAA